MLLFPLSSFGVVLLPSSFVQRMRQEGAMEASAKVARMVAKTHGEAKGVGEAVARVRTVVEVSDVAARLGQGVK
eukprot:1444962-Amphidinium_carterae.1